MRLVVRTSDKAAADSLSRKGLLELELQRTDDQTKKCSSLTVIREHGSREQI